MKTIVSILVFALIPFIGIAADDATQLKDDAIDSLFTGEDGTAGNDTKTDANKTDIISELLPNGIELGANFSLYAGYSPGLNYLPGDVTDPALIEYADLVLLDMTCSFSINARFSPDLKLLSRLTARLPDFSTEITELYCDFNVLRSVFIRIGRIDPAWGISPNFSFTNLLARVPVSQVNNNKTADSIACLVNTPFGVGGLDLVAFSRTSLWEAPDKPTIDEIGFGTKANLALPNFDFSIGGFYHKDLPLRFYYSLSTTLFESIETYTEALASTNLLSVADLTLVTWYFSGNLGFYFDLFSKALRINGEYFFCGENEALTIKGADFTLIPGHNIALNASLSLAGGQWKIYFQCKYNISENSGYLIPAVTFDAFSDIVFSLGVPITLGPATGEYFVQIRSTTTVESAQFLPL